MHVLRLEKPSPPLKGLVFIKDSFISLVILIRQQYYSILNADAHIECVNSIILNTEQKIKGHEEKTPATDLSARTDCCIRLILLQK